VPSVEWIVGRIPYLSSSGNISVCYLLSEAVAHVTIGMSIVATASSEIQLT